jgi:aryl-alcohol dehydrogenase-like predicted oxidoreductase
MRYVTLRAAGIRVSVIAFGTWELGGHWGQVDEQEAIRAIRRARELGINLFDTAQAYGFGAAERLLARALRADLDHRRDEVVIATKGGMQFTASGMPYADSNPKYLQQGVDDSLRALGTDYIDIYQVHAPDRHVPFAETAGLLSEFVKQGKVRHIGVSNYGAAQLAAFSASQKAETLQLPYSLFCRGAESEELPYALARDVGVLAYAPLAHGLLSGSLHENTEFTVDDWRHWLPFFHDEVFRRNLTVVRKLAQFARERLDVTLPQLSIAWTLVNPAVDVAIVGARHANHIEDSAGASDLALGGDAVTAVEEIMADADPLPVTRYEKEP